MLDPQTRWWYCEIEDKRLAWGSEFWPTFCPLCGKAVNRDLSTHHWIEEERPEGGVRYAVAPYVPTEGET